MEVALISPHPDSNSGGVERFCNVLRDCLIEGGHSAEVLGPSDGPSNAQVVITNGMIGWSHDPTATRVHVYHGSWPTHVLRGGLDGSSWRSTARRLVEGASAEFRAGYGAHRVSVSSSAEREVKMWYGLSSTTIENGVDTSIFSPCDRLDARKNLEIDDDRPLALFVGRPEGRKGSGLALATADQLGLLLLHAGAPQFPGSLWLGDLSPAALARALSAVDVVVLPSLYEGCSFAVLEALACGAPLVATRTGWVPDLIKDVPEFNRYVAEPGDLKSLIIATRRVLNDDPGVQRAAHFLVLRNNSLDAFGARWIDYLESIVGGCRRPEGDRARFARGPKDMVNHRRARGFPPSTRGRRLWRRER